MFKNQNIIAIQKIREDKNTTGSWNNSNIKWFIVCPNANGGKLTNYQIALDMVYLSSKREVRVNGHLVYSAMATFGFQCQFTISPLVQAKIKQNGINFDFQLYINDISFSELQKNKPKYEGINSKQLDKLISKNQQQKKQPQKLAVTQQKPPTLQIKKQNPNQNPSLNPDPVYITTALTEAQKIKQTQNQLLKILKAEKSRKN